MGDSESNYFSTKDLITTNRGRNLTITDRNYGLMK